MKTPKAAEVVRYITNECRHSSIQSSHLMCTLLHSVRLVQFYDIRYKNDHSRWRRVYNERRVPNSVSYEVGDRYLHMMIAL